MTEEIYCYTYFTPFFGFLFYRAIVELPANQFYLIDSLSLCLIKYKHLSLAPYGFVSR